MSGSEPPANNNGENGPALKTRAETIQYLKDSYTAGHKAIAAITPANLVDSIPSPFGQGTTTRLGLATLAIGHGFDHYGQLVEYLRMNGTVPPASR